MSVFKHRVPHSGFCWQYIVSSTQHMHCTIVLRHSYKSSLLACCPSNRWENYKTNHLTHMRRWRHMDSLNFVHTVQIIACCLTALRHHPTNISLSLVSASSLFIMYQSLSVFGNYTFKVTEPVNPPELLAWCHHLFRWRIPYPLYHFETCHLSQELPQNCQYSCRQWPRSNWRA